MPRPGSQAVPASVGATIRSVDENSMGDTCTITRPDDELTFNAELDGFAAAAGTPVLTALERTEWPCRIVQADTGERTPTMGEQQITLTRYYVSIPVDGDEVKIGDVVTPTGCRDLALVGLLGREYHVSGVGGHETIASARLLTVEDRRP